MVKESRRKGKINWKGDKKPNAERDNKKEDKNLERCLLIIKELKNNFWKYRMKKGEKI